MRPRGSFVRIHLKKHAHGTSPISDSEDIKSTQIERCLGRGCMLTAFEAICHRRLDQALFLVSCCPRPWPLEIDQGIRRFTGSRTSASQGSVAMLRASKPASGLKARIRAFHAEAHRRILKARRARIRASLARSEKESSTIAPRLPHSNDRDSNNPAIQQQSSSEGDDDQTRGGAEDLVAALGLVEVGDLYDVPPRPLLTYIPSRPLLRFITGTSTLEFRTRPRSPVNRRIIGSGRYRGFYRFACSPS